MFHDGFNPRAFLIFLLGNATFVQVIRGPAIFLALTLYKGGVFFLAFFFWHFFFGPGSWWLLWLRGFCGFYGPGSLWLRWLLVAPGGFCGSWWLLVASAASVASMASMAPGS